MLFYKTKILVIRFYYIYYIFIILNFLFAYRLQNYDWIFYRYYYLLIKYIEFLSVCMCVHLINYAIKDWKINYETRNKRKVKVI